MKNIINYPKSLEIFFSTDLMRILNLILLNLIKELRNSLILQKKGLGRGYVIYLNGIITMPLGLVLRGNTKNFLLKVFAGNAMVIGLIFLQEMFLSEKSL